MEVGDVLLEKVRFEIAMDLKATELTIHPYTWTAFETQLRRMDLEGADESKKLKLETVEVIGGRTLTYLEGLRVCLDPDFPLFSMLVS